jgi:hypothetical protein
MGDELYLSNENYLSFRINLHLLNKIIIINIIIKLALVKNFIKYIM